jgi:hypothetical protein
MPECSAVSESMPLLLTESLDAERRELTHQHIEGCEVCSEEWNAYKDTWAVMGDLPDRRAGAREDGVPRARGTPSEAELPKNVVPFHKRVAFKWVAQAAAVVVLVGGAYFLGDKNADKIATSTATIDSVTPNGDIRTVSTKPMALSETRVLDADALSPSSKDVRTSRTCIHRRRSVRRSDRRLVRRHVALDGQRKSARPQHGPFALVHARERARDHAALEHAQWVRQTYSDPQYADPEIANALAKVLRNDSHEGVRIRAVDTLTTLPPTVGTQARDALIEALKSDPNPAVRIKAVEALANMTRNGETLDPAMVDTLREKASQDDENLYVRVKAAEALSNIKP